MKRTEPSMLHSTLSKVLIKIAPEGKSIYNRFISIITDYRLGQYDKLAVDAGKFVEEIVKIIAKKEGVRVDKIIKRTIDNISNTLNNKKDHLYKEKKAVLEIAYYSIYNLRNIRDAAHANSSKISDWDSRHIVETSIWVLQELLRIYGNVKEEDIINIFFPFVGLYETLKLVEIIDGKLIPLKDNISGKELVLYALFISGNCLTPKEVIKAINGIKPSTVYVHLRNLAKDNLVVNLKKSGRVCYKITSKGRKYIFDKLYEYSDKRKEVV